MNILGIGHNFETILSNKKKMLYRTMIVINGEVVTSSVNH